MPYFNQGTILANQTDIEIVAQDPGDIVAIFMPSRGTGQSARELGTVKIPLKAFTCDKSIDVNQVYGTGSHLPYQQVYGKVGYKGSFTINTWISQDEKMRLERIIYSQEQWEGTPQEFDILILDRQSGREAASALANAGHSEYMSSNVIVKVLFCALTSSGIDIGEPGNVIATKYEFVALRRIPR